MLVGRPETTPRDFFYDSLSAANAKKNQNKTNPDEVKEAEREREQHSARRAARREEAMRFFHDYFPDSRYMHHLTLSTKHVGRRLLFVWIGFNARLNQFQEITFNNNRWNYTVPSEERLVEGVEKARKQDKKIQKTTAFWERTDDGKQHTSHVLKDERAKDADEWQSIRTHRERQLDKDKQSAERRQEDYQERTQNQQESTSRPDLLLDARRASKEALEARGQLKPEEIAMIRKMIEERKATPSKDTDLDEMREEWEKTDHMLMALLETLERKNLLTMDEMRRTLSQAHVHVELGPDGEIAKDSSGQPKQTVARISHKNYMVSVE